METFNLNIIPGKTWPVCHVSQFDIGRVIRANLFEGSAVYTLDGTETVSVSARKPDGNVVTAAVTNTNDSYVEIITTEQMCACAGENLCELKIEKGDDVIGTLDFIMAVEKDPLDGGIESESEIHNLTTQIQDINDSIVPGMVADEVASQYDSQNVIFDDHPTPGHGTGYVVKSENVPDELNDLTDVNISSPTSNQALVYDPNSGTWINGEVSTVGSIDDLNDVDTTGKANADSLRYNATAQEWEAKPTTVEMTLAEYTALGGDYSGYENTNIIITDAPNLNATAQQISYDGGADTVWDKVEAVDELANKYNDASILCTATVTEPTLSNGTSVNNRTYYYKKGTRVFVSIAVSGLTPNSNQLLFTLPSGYRPSTIILPIGCDDSFNMNTVLLVKTDGNIEMRKNATQAYCFFEFDAFA